MISINSLREYLVECKAEFPKIKKTQLLYDDSTIVEFMKDHAAGEDIYFLSIIPEFSSHSKNEDSVLFSNMLSFLFLEKVNYNDISYDEELLVFHRTLELAKKFVTKLLEESGNSTCHEMNKINWETLEIVPIKNLASCNGYGVEFSLKTYI